MQWSKIKKQFETRLAPGLRSRLQVHLTEYTKSSVDVGRGWITLDGGEICSVQIPSFFSDGFCFSTETLDFGKALHAYLSLSANEALGSSDPIIQGLSFLDARVGKRRLAAIDEGSLHEFARLLYSVRRDAEGIALQRPQDASNPPR